MKNKLSPAAGHGICLSVLLMICCVAVIVTKAFLPAYILPRITITLLIGMSLLSVILEVWIFQSEGTPEYLMTGLLTAAAFFVMTLAVGLAGVFGAVKVGIVGGIVYTLCLLVINAMRAQLESAGTTHKGGALTLAAALLLLASQSLAGIPILT